MTATRAIRAEGGSEGDMVGGESGPRGQEGRRGVGVGSTPSTVGQLQDRTANRRLQPLAAPEELSVRSITAIKRGLGQPP